MPTTFNFYVKFTILRKEHGLKRRWESSKSALPKKTNLDLDLDLAVALDDNARMEHTKMTSEELGRISTTAVLSALEARKKSEDGHQASDFGLRARAWERLADAANALQALTERDSSFSSGPPNQIVPG